MSATAAIEPPASLQMFFDNLDSFAEAPKGVAKLRELILDLAVRGKLVEQDENDEPASALFGQIQSEKDELFAAGKLRRPKRHAELNGDVPYEIPSSWMWTRLGNLQIFTNGFAFKSHDYQDSGVGIVRIGDIQDGEIDTSGMKFVPATFLDELDERLQVKPGDLLIAMSGATTGKLGFNRTDDTFLLNQRVGKIELIKVDPRYACFFLTTKVQENLRISAGSAIPNLSTVQINDAPFPLPPLSEQRRIVSKVDGLMSLCDELESRGREQVRVRERASRSCLDRLVKSSSRRELKSEWQRLSDHFEVLYETPETIADLRQSILQLAVQGKLVPQDPNDEPAEELLERVTAKRQQLLLDGKLPKRKALALDENGGPLFDTPKGWTWSHFDEIADIAGGVTKGRKLQGRETSWYPYLRVANVQRWRLNLDVMKDIEIPVNELEKYRLQKGDLVLTEGGDWDKLGRTAVWQGEIENCLHQNHVFRARLIDDDIERSWIMLFTNSRVGRGYFENASKKTTNLASINMTQLRSCPIPLPPLAEQKRIVAKVDQLLARCDELSAQLRERQAASQPLLAATIHQLLDEV